MTRLKEFEQILGKEMFSTHIKMLKEIGPDARTERISVVIAAMLRYALKQVPDGCGAGSLSEALLAIEEEPHLAQEEAEEAERLSRGTEPPQSQAA